MERFLSPVFVTDPARVQAWLEDQAAQGWFYLRPGFNVFCWFETGTPRALRCRLEPRRAKEPDQDHRELCQAMGWEYAGRWGSFWIWQCADPDVPEFYTDPQVQGEAYRVLFRKSWRSRLLTLALTALYAAFLAWAFSQVGFLYKSVHSFTSFWRSTGFLIFFTALLTLSAAREVSLRRFVKSLRQGIPQVNRKPYGRSLAASAAYFACSLYWVFASFMVLMEPSSRRFSPVEEFGRPVPYVTAETLGYAGWSAGAEALRVNNYLTAEQWWVMEDHWATEALWEGHSRDWLGRVTTEYYRMRLPSLGRALAESMAEQEMSRGAELSLKEDPGFGLEGAYLGTWPDGVQTLICWREGQVLSAECRGDVNLGEHLGDYAALLAER